MARNIKFEFLVIVPPRLDRVAARRITKKLVRKHAEQMQKRYEKIGNQFSKGKRPKFQTRSGEGTSPAGSPNSIYAGAVNVGRSKGSHIIGWLDVGVKRTRAMPRGYRSLTKPGTLSTNPAHIPMNPRPRLRVNKYIKARKFTQQIAALQKGKFQLEVVQTLPDQLGVAVWPGQSKLTKP